MAIGGTMIFARNELIELVHCIDRQLERQRELDQGVSKLLPEVRRRLMIEINRIDTEGDW